MSKAVAIIMLLFALAALVIEGVIIRKEIKEDEEL